jgi:hypothetical protein
MSSDFDPGLTQRIVTKAKARIVPNWRSRLRDYSTIALGAVTALSTAMLAAWAVMPTEWKAALPANAMLYLGSAYLAIGAWGGIGKFITQAPKPEFEGKPP